MITERNKFDLTHRLDELNKNINQFREKGQCYSDKLRHDFQHLCGNFDEYRFKKFQENLLDFENILNKLNRISNNFIEE
jgi:hypothetical protein